MAIVTDLLDLFSDTVTVELPEADDGFGNEGFASGVDRAAHVGAGGELRTIPGQVQQYVTKGKVTFAGAFGVTRGARLTLPSDFSPRKVIVEEVVKLRDEDGTHHDKAFF